MKKTLIALIMILLAGSLLTSCVTSRGGRGGCPSHNPKYFRS